MANIILLIFCFLQVILVAAMIGDTSRIYAEKANSNTAKSLHLTYGCVILQVAQLLSLAAFRPSDITLLKFSVFVMAISCIFQVIRIAVSRRYSS